MNEAAFRKTLVDTLIGKRAFTLFFLLYSFQHIYIFE